MNPHYTDTRNYTYFTLFYNTYTFFDEPIGS